MCAAYFTKWQSKWALSQRGRKGENEREAKFSLVLFYIIGTSTTLIPSYDLLLIKINPVSLRIPALPGLAKISPAYTNALTNPLRLNQFDSSQLESGFSCESNSSGNNTSY